MSVTAAKNFAADARPLRVLADGMETSDGAGVRMTRMVGTPNLRTLDPFLMLDYFGSDEAADYLAGFPDHPHRGFETVTYMLAGRMRHWDNKGNSGVIEPGGVQWMTAGRGLIHSEMPEQTEGLMKGFQLWINLPAARKMIDPRYQEFPASDIPVESREDGVELTVIAGTTSRGTAGPIQAGTTDARYFDVRLPPNTRFSEVMPEGHRVALALFEGDAFVPGRGGLVSNPKMLVLGDGERIEVEAGPHGARFLVLAGLPINEPIAWAGPIVMNTREEIHQAFRDIEAGLL